MDIFRRGCARGGGLGRKIFQASLQYRQVQSRRGSGQAGHVVQKWIWDPILYVNIRINQIESSFSSNFCVAVTMQWKMSTRPKSGGTSKAKSRAEVSLTEPILSFPRQSSETRALTGTEAPVVRHSASVYSLAQLFKTLLQFNKTATSSLKFSKESFRSEVSLFLRVVQTNAPALLFRYQKIRIGFPWRISGWYRLYFSLTLQMPRGLSARPDHLRQQPPGRDHAAPRACDYCWPRPHPWPGRHLAPGHGGRQPRARVSGVGRPASTQPHLVDRQPPPGPGVHSVSDSHYCCPYDTTKVHRVKSFQIDQYLLKWLHNKYILFYFGHFNHHGRHETLLIAMERLPGTGWCWPPSTGRWWTRWLPARRATPTSPYPATPPSSWTWCSRPSPSPSSPPRPRWCWVRRSASSALWPGRGQSPSSSGWARSPVTAQRFSTKWVCLIFL